MEPIPDLHIILDRMKALMDPGKTMSHICPGLAHVLRKTGIII